MVFSCSNSNEGFESRIKPPTASNPNGALVYCFIEAENKCSRDEGLKISEELCEEVGGRAVTSCNSEYGEIPDFVCKWDEEEYATNDIATLSFNMLGEGDSNCERKIVSDFFGKLDTLNFEELDEEIIVKDSVYRLKISGYLYCKKDDPDDEDHPLEAYSDSKSCGSFDLSPVSPPRTEGKLVLNTDYFETTGIYYYIGTVPSTATSNLAVINPSALCTGDVKYKLSINGSTTIRAVALGDTVKAVATVVCNGEERELASAMAVVVPDPVLSDCVWDSTGIVMFDSISTTRRRAPVMHEDQTLRISATLSNSYGRCGPNVLYSFNGAAESVDGTLSLSGLANRGQSSNNALSAKAVAPCPRNAIPDKVCARVADVFVAYHRKIDGGCERDNNKFPFKNGRTVLEFACEEEKSIIDIGTSYYINCRCEGSVCDESFEVVVEGGATKGNGHNGWNFYPGLPTVKDGALWRYPVPALIKTNGDLTCGIW
jgi:hypothetical protein